MHTFLQSVREKTAQRETLEGQEKLTGHKIRKIASYYGYAPADTLITCRQMQNKAAQAALRHMAPTDGAPDPSLCPDGPSSYCKYNRAAANGEEAPAHEDALPDPV